MKSTGILFSAPMVLAILAGTKTQTRRVVKGAALEWLRPEGFTPTFTAAPENHLSPYGFAGDQLWVREAWRADRAHDALPPRDIPQGAAAFMEASAHLWRGGPHDGEPGKLRPGMFMPRWASRITLELTEVRIERLHDISEKDGRAEGAPCIDEVTGREVLFPDASRIGSWRLGYRWLWEQINGPGAWELNPWVWVLTFRRM